MSATAVIHWLAREDAGVLVGVLESVGVEETTLQRLRAPGPWAPDQCADMQNALRQIIYGGAALAHYQEIDIPVQFSAAIVAEFVHPMNWMTACHLFRRSFERTELKQVDERVTPIDPVSPTKMFAYVSEWADGDRTMLSEIMESQMRNKARKKAS